MTTDIINSPVFAALSLDARRVIARNAASPDLLALVERNAPAGTLVVDCTNESITFTISTVAQDEADAIAARFPKSAKFVGQGCSSVYGTYGYKRSYTRLAADDANGGRNETGIKRALSILKHAERLGITVAYAPQFSNSLTYDEMMAYLTNAPCDHEFLDHGNGYSDPITCEGCGVEMEYTGDGIDRSRDGWTPV